MANGDKKATKDEGSTGTAAPEAPAAPAVPVKEKSKLDDGKKHTIDELATDAGYLPQLVPVPPPKDRPNAVVQPRVNFDYAIYARAKQFHRWLPNMELTKPEFDDLIAASEKASVYR